VKFEKGHKKLGGIKKGQVQAKRAAWDQLSEYILGEGVDRYMSIINELPDNDFLDRFENILEYFKPKLARTQTDLTTNGESIVWNEVKNYGSQSETNNSN
jgi:hypothetical protein